MSEQANSGQASTDTVEAGANVTTESQVETQAAGDQPNDTSTQVDAGKTGEQAGVEGGKGTTDEGAQGDKPDGDKPGEGKQDDKPGTAPDSYEFQAPEGVTLDETLVGEFTGIAKELGLSQDDAQKIVDLGPKVMQKFADAQAQTIVDVQAQWAKDSQADKEFGGDNLDANLAVSKRALDEFGSDELKTLLVDSGLGNHPEVIRVFYRIGKAISNDGLVTGRQTANTPKTLADRLYATPST